MALFKILKGDSSRIDISITPFHDGYAYFTPDDGGFYIDSEDNGTQRRIRVNPFSGNNSVAVNAVLPASGWSSNKQMLKINGITKNSNGIIGVSQDITETQMEAVKNAELYVDSQNTDTLTVAASGNIPNCDIPVIVILIG